MKKATILVIAAGTTLLAVSPLAAQRPARPEQGRTRGTEMLKRLDQRLDRMEKAIRTMGQSLKQLGARARVQEKRLQGLEKGGTKGLRTRRPEQVRARVLRESQGQGQPAPQGMDKKRLLAMKKMAQARRSQAQQRRTAIRHRIEKRIEAVPQLRQRIEKRVEAAPLLKQRIRARLVQPGPQRPMLKARLENRRGRALAHRRRPGIQGHPGMRGFRRGSPGFQGQFSRQAVLRFLKAHPGLARALKAYFTGRMKGETRPPRAAHPRRAILHRAGPGQAPMARRQFLWRNQEQREGPRRFHL